MKPSRIDLRILPYEGHDSDVCERDFIAAKAMRGCQPFFEARHVAPALRAMRPGIGAGSTLGILVAIQMKLELAVAFGNQRMHLFDARTHAGRNHCPGSSRASAHRMMSRL